MSIALQELDGLRARARGWGFWVGLCVLGLSLGCGSFGSPGEPPSGVWRLEEMFGKPVPRLPGNRAPTLTFEQDALQVNGFTGCNRITGGYVLAGKDLSFTAMASTRMACQNAGATVEMNFMEAIQEVSRWRRKGERLELLDDKGHPILVFEQPGRVDRPLPKE